MIIINYIIDYFIFVGFFIVSVFLKFSIKKYSKKKIITNKRITYYWIAYDSLILSSVGIIITIIDFNLHFNLIFPIYGLIVCMYFIIVNIIRYYIKKSK